MLGRRPKQQTQGTASDLRSSSARFRTSPRLRSSLGIRSARSLPTLSPAADSSFKRVATLKAAPLLHGFRGAPKADVTALAQLISQISVLAAQHRGEIAEIEVNPVLVHPEGQGVTIVDALVVPRS